MATTAKGIPLYDGATPAAPLQALFNGHANALDTALSNIQGTDVAAASESARGTVALATKTEIRTGTDNAKAVTPKALADAKLPGKLLAHASASGATTSGWSSGASLSAVTGAAAASASVTVDAPTQVIISARGNFYTSGGSSPQLGVNLSGVTTFTTPTDHISVGKVATGDDGIALSQLITTLNPGTTTVTLSARATTASLRGTQITVVTV